MGTKFKIGDQVREVVGNHAGTITDVDENGLYLADFGDSNIWWNFETDLELLHGAAPDTSTAMKFDTGKPRVSLIPSVAIEMEGAVLGFGEQKYASHNWRKGMKYSKLIDSAIRHLLKLKEGEDIDAESGLPHWAHVRCNMGFLGEYMTYNLGEDDRYKVPKKFKSDPES